MNTIVFPTERLLEEHRALRLRFSAQGPVSSSLIEVSVSSGQAGVQILVPPRRVPEYSGRLKTLRLVLSASLTGDSAGQLLTDGAEAALALGEGAELGRAKGWVRTASGGIKPVDQLILPGPPGVLKIDLRHADGTDGTDNKQSNAIFSRVEGALTPAVFRSWRRLGLACVGAGRLNTCMAIILARDGARRFVMIDPDRYELHNGGGGLAGSPNSVGFFKTRVLGEALRGIDPAIQVEEVPQSVTHSAALHALIRSEVLICAVDQDSARLAAGVVACLYNKVLLDVGVGILNKGGRRRMAVDVRLLWPGKCLGCFGGVRAQDDAIRALTSAEAERVVRETPTDWRQQRTGSLTSLNAVAAGVAVRLLEDFLGGRVTENGLWVRIEFDERGQVRVEHPQPRAASRCLCRWAGLGHEGLKPMMRSLAIRESA